jgi:peptide/nickel transport system permease protein
MNLEVTKALSKRIISSIITLFLLISFLFIIIRLAPGDPTQKFVSAKLGTELSEKVVKSYKLDKPLHEQYISFVINIAKGDFGISYNFRKPVLSVIWDFLSFTLVFATLTFFIQIVLSLLLSLFVVKKKNKWIDNSVSNIALLIYSTPAFVLGVLLIFIFSVHLNLLPTSGLRSLDFDSFSFIGKLLDQFNHLILPLITLSAAGTAMFYKYLKENLTDVYQKTFVLNLRASGVSESEVLRKHFIPNSLRPLVSVAGIELGILFGGTLITEVIFSLPGMGRITIDSILSRDYPLIIGCTLVAGVLMILTNFIADIVKIKMDKRMLKGMLN